MKNPRISKLAALTLAASLTLSLAACGTDEPAKGVATPANTGTSTNPLLKPGAEAEPVQEEEPEKEEEPVKEEKPVKAPLADVLPNGHPWKHLPKEFQLPKEAVKALGKEDAEHGVNTGVAAFYDFFEADAVAYTSKGDDRSPEGMEAVDTWGSKRLFDAVKKEDGTFDNNEYLWSLLPHMRHESKDGSSIAYQALMTTEMVTDNFTGTLYEIVGKPKAAGRLGFSEGKETVKFIPAKDKVGAQLVMSFGYETETSGYEAGSSTLQMYEGAHFNTLHLEQTETGAWEVTFPTFTR